MLAAAVPAEEFDRVEAERKALQALLNERDAEIDRLRGLVGRVVATGALTASQFDALEAECCAVNRVETLYEKGGRLYREGYGLSCLWGMCKSDEELPEVHRGWLHARAALK